MRLGGVFKDALGNFVEKWFKTTEDGDLIVTTTGASGASKDRYYATGGATTTFDFTWTAGNQPTALLVTIEGTGLAKVCLNAPSFGTRDAWLADAGGLVTDLHHRRLTKDSSVESRSFIVDPSIAKISKLSISPDANVTGVSVEGI